MIEHANLFHRVPFILGHCRFGKYRVCLYCLYFMPLDQPDLSCAPSSEQSSYHQTPTLLTCFLKSPCEWVWPRKRGPLRVMV